MKVMVCEICGGHNLIKQNGLFVCQDCGTKYAVEEARNLLVDMDGAVNSTPAPAPAPVKNDNSEQISRFLELVKSSYSGNDHEGTVNYCDKILEIDSENLDAWVYKAKSACWIESKLNNIKIASSISAAKRAISIADESSKTEIAESIYWELKKNIVALLNISYKMPGVSGCEYIHLIMINWNNMLVEIPNLSNGLIEKEINECATLCKNSKSAIMPVKRLVYSAYFAYNKRESYDAMFRRNLGR